MAYSMADLVGGWMAGWLPPAIKVQPKSILIKEVFLQQGHFKRSDVFILHSQIV